MGHGNALRNENYREALSQKAPCQKDWLLSITRSPRTSMHNFGSGGKGRERKLWSQGAASGLGTSKNRAYIWKTEVIRETSEMLVATQNFAGLYNTEERGH